MSMSSPDIHEYVAFVEKVPEGTIPASVYEKICKSARVVPSINFISVTFSPNVPTLDIVTLTQFPGQVVENQTLSKIISSFILFVCVENTSSIACFCVAKLLFDHQSIITPIMLTADKIMALVTTFASARLLIKLQCFLFFLCVLCIIKIYPLFVLLLIVCKRS